MKFTTTFEVSGVKYKNTSEHETEYYARVNTLKKAREMFGCNVVITGCKAINPFIEEPDIIKFLKGFQK